MSANKGSATKNASAQGKTASASLGEVSADKASRRKTANASAKNARGGKGGPKAGSLHAARGPVILASPTSANTPLPSSDPELPAQMVDIVPTFSRRMTQHLRQPSAKFAGRDKEGNVIPHHRSEEIAIIVAEMSSAGVSLNAMAVRLNLRPGQIKECYPAELEYSAELADAQVVSTAHAMATSGESEGMTKFWLQARKKWRTTDAGEGKDVSLFNIHIHNEA